MYSGKIQPHIDRPLKKIDHEALSKIIEELPNNPLLTGMDNAPRLSLAGAQSKFAVYKGTDGKYYRSDDEHPTTHIIKIANKYFNGLLENELFCMTLAKKIFKDAIDVRLDSVDVYPKKTVSHQIAMTINGKGTYASLYRKDWEALFAQLNLNATSMMKEMQKTFSHIVDDGRKLADILDKDALTSSDIYEKILKNVENRYRALFD